MRRTDKEITDRAVIEAILAEAPVCRLGMSRDNRPYIVALNFVYHDNCLYMHCAPEGAKLDIMRVNPTVCFEVATRVAIVPTETSCSWTCKYFSVVGWGRVTIVQDRASKHRAFELFMQKFSGRDNWQFPDDVLNDVALLRVDISEMTGKRSGYDTWSPSAVERPWLKR